MARLHGAKDFDSCKMIMQELKQTRIETSPEEKLGWYFRHRANKDPNNENPKSAKKITKNK